MEVRGVGRNGGAPGTRAPHPRLIQALAQVQLAQVQGLQAQRFVSDMGCSSCEV